MAKKTNSSSNRPLSNDPVAPSRGPMLVLLLGSLAVAGLVVWALTRTVEPAVPAAAVTQTSPVVPQNDLPLSQTTGTAAGSTTPATPASGTEGGVARVSAAQLNDLVNSGNVTVLDVRDSVSYTNGHIPGAIHIPFARVEAEAGNLPKGKPLVAYCT